MTTPRRTKNNDFVDQWMQMIKIGKRYRKKFSDQDKWVEYRKMYRAEWKESIIPINEVYSNGRGMIPKVYFRSPRVSVTATKPGLAYHAKVVEEIDNWLIREIVLKNTLKKAAMIAYLNGTAPIKLGYDSEFGYMPSQAVDFDRATVTQYSKKTGRNIEYRTNIKPGLPWALCELPENVIVPYGYNEPESLPWIAHKILRPVQDVKEDQKYRNTSKLKGTRVTDIDDIQKYDRVFEGIDEMLFAELYEIRDVGEGRVYVICENEVLLDDEDALQIEGLPWEFLIFNQDPEYFWGIPDVKQIESQQADLNETRTQTRMHKQIALLKFLYLGGSISESELEKLLSGQVGPAVRIDGEGIGNAILPLQPHVPPDLYMDKRETQAEIARILGQSENYRGAFKEGTPPSAQEVTEAAGSGDVRDLERRDIVGDCLTNIVRKFNQFIFSFWTQERVVEIAGPQGATQWVTYTGDQLRGEYSLKIDPDSGFPITRMLRHEISNALLKMYNGDPLIDQVRLRMQHLQQFEWIFPGAIQLIKQVDPQMATELGYMRQPSPMGGAGSGSQRLEGNRGGGRTSGEGAVIPFERARSNATL